MNSISDQLVHGAGLLQRLGPQIEELVLRGRPEFDPGPQEPVYLMIFDPQVVIDTHQNLPSWSTPDAAPKAARAYLQTGVIGAYSPAARLDPQGKRLSLSDTAMIDGLRHMPMLPTGMEERLRSLEAWGGWGGQVGVFAPPVSLLAAPSRPYLITVAVGWPIPRACQLVAQLTYGLVALEVDQEPPSSEWD